MDTVSLAVLLGVLSVSWARPQLPSAPSAPAGPMAPAPFAAPAPAPAASTPTFVPIIQQLFEQAPDGQYRWNYSGADGSTQEAMGVLSPASPDTIAVQGSYSYQSPEGQVQVNYIADEYGFQPSGAHIHPGILEAVRRQVEFARSEPANLYNEAGFPINQVLQVAAPMHPPPPQATVPSGPALF